jgi:glutamate-1-semialdehyde 2,1-aminomutase/spore coat polysaccharide biosynthesis protein SpsF
MTVVAVVQARMSSSRFPGKMLAPLAGVPLAVAVCRRVARAARVSRVVLATSDQPEDEPLATAVAAAGFRVHRGELDDVLARFTAAARGAGATTVVRITGDCPLIDPQVLDAMLERFATGDLGYLSNVAPPTFPDGLDCEITTLAALETACAEAKPGHDREHVTPFIRQRPERWPAANHPCPLGDFSDYHWSVDRPEHLALVTDLLAEAGPEALIVDLLAAARRRPDLQTRSRAGERPNAGGIATFKAALLAQPRPTITASDALWQRSQGLIPAGTQTLSKGPTQWVRGFAPKYLARGKGSHVWDVDGNEFIDYPLGLGPVTIGHGHPAVVEAVTRALVDGNSHSLMHPLEVELAERLRPIIPCARDDGMIRFGKNGSDATAACIRAARALTGRVAVARHGYHGWQDWAIEKTYGARAKGVPAEVMALTTTFPYNDLAALETLLASKPHAAVIMEPVNLTPPNPGYLEGCRDLTHTYGAVFIFDEVITGFRYARGGAQEHFGVTPDLCAMGKGVANGLPLAVVAGSREYMAPFEDIFFSFTFGGETLGLAAAQATLDVMERENYWSHVWRQGGKLQDGYRAIAREFGVHGEITDCMGMPPWTAVVFKDTPRWSALQLKSLFQQEMLRRGILFSGSQFISLAHDDVDIARTIEAYREAMRVVRTALDLQAVDEFLCGQPNDIIFRRG